MKRIFSIVILLALSPTLVKAFGLGKLDLNSALNEPFDAKIQLLSPTADELDSLKINLADSNAFAKAKINRPFILSKLRFALHRSDDGPDYIRVYSLYPIREPFLTFLVEASWSNGRLFREYTVLLDPPLYDPSMRAGEFAQAPRNKSVSKRQEAQEAVSPASTYTPNINYTAGDYGPTVKFDTLWSIASKMRPDNSISVNQMMLALLRTNPDAFINDNINGLKRGKTLRMPSESEINALSYAEALAEAKSQHSDWENIKERLFNVSKHPEAGSISETKTVGEGETTAKEKLDEATLKLISAGDFTEDTGHVSSVEQGAGEELILAQETVQALTQENTELKDRVQESEALLTDLKRLLSLKDDELANLQEQIAASEAPAEMTTEESVAKQDVKDETKEDVIEIELEPSSGMMARVNQYLVSAKNLVLGYPIVAMAVGGLIVLFMIIVMLLKFRKGAAETVDINAMTEEAHSDIDSSDLGETSEDVSDSGAITLSPDSEDETELPDNDEDTDFNLEEEAVEKTPLAQAQPEQEEKNPLHEVDTYLVFEQFEQAEECARNAINDDPDNPEYHTKLLEVFYTSGNKKGYQEAAKALHDKVDGKGEYWDIATAMWQEISPNRALFEAEHEDKEDVADNTGRFVNITADEKAGDDVLDITAASDEGMLDITGSNEAEDMLDITPAVSMEGDDVNLEAKTAQADSVDDVLDISGASGSDLLDLTSSGDITAAADLDLDPKEDLLDVTATMSTAADSTENAAKSDKSAENDNVLDFDMSSDEGSDNVELDMDLGNFASDSNVDDMSIEFDVSGDGNDNGNDVELDLSIGEDNTSMALDLSLDETVELPKNSFPFDKEKDDNDDDHTTVFVPSTAQSEEQSAEDEIATKLDLAKAYVELGDKDSAKTILDEVIADGDDEQRKQAEDLLGQV